ncbi:ABC transporter ATP-binding protein [Bradyrhizobium sp. CIAT3101]|uniref:ABC transporter ATP-binding protein n=1 Tax=Bradyrhizobium sp. CIAT3101 TaxID=439387 RepID=UPI0024B1859F|nr:ABC transporter ATP-binding protein [Bradyrhizobium sp. CIAT3101]WFU79225.1 ABC transporter ATP-binding protein [Bradyrhizobium sp. CIAT3101]
MLHLDGLEAGYGSGKVLFGVNLEAPAGQVTAIIGRNGVGKTTTLKAILGFLAVSAGRISLDGKDLSRKQVHDVVRAGIGYVPEGRQIFPTLTVLENLRVGQRRPPQVWTEERLLELFPNLRERSQNLGRALSGGEQQMLAIARALVTDVKVLMLDEPTQGLAPKVVDQIGDVIRRLKAEGVAVLLVEQNLNLTENVADRILVMSKGRIVETVTGEGFRTNGDEIRHRWLTI